MDTPAPHESSPIRYTLQSLDGTISHDATALLGPGCWRKLEIGCAYSTERLNEVAHRPLKELAGQRKWRFMMENNHCQNDSDALSC